MIPDTIHTELITALRYSSFTRAHAYRCVLGFFLGLFFLIGNVEAREVRVGVYQNEPKVFTGTNGQPTGIFIDILQAIAAKENWQLSYVSCEWNSCLKQLADGHIDLMPDVAHSPERDRKFDFHKTPVLNSWSQIYRRVDQKLDSTLDLKNKRVAVLQSSIQEKEFGKLIKDYGLTVELISAPTMEKVFDLAEAGKTDAAVSNHHYGDFHAAEHDLVATSIVFQPVHLHFATVPGRHPELLAAIDRHLATWQKDRHSEYYGILKKWNKHEPTLTIPPLVKQAFLFVTLLLLLTGIVALVLRQRLQTKTSNLARLTKLYKALSQCNQAIVRCNDEAELFPLICHDVVQFGGMKMAWIGLLDETRQLVKPLAAFGSGIEYLDGMEISIDAGDPKGRGPTGIAMRENRPFWCQDFQHAPETNAWHERAARFGWGASASIPILRKGVVVGAFTLYADQVNAFDEPARNLLVEMSMDISYALNRFADEAERKQIEQNLSESEARYRTAFQTSPDAVNITRMSDGQYLDVNSGFERITGWTKDEVVGRTSSEINVWHNRADRERLVEELKRDGRCINLEADFNLKSGGIIRGLMSAERIQLNGEPCILSITRDITEHRHMEDALRKLSLAVEQSPNTIIITDLDARIEYANETFTKVTGYSLEEVKGKNPRILQSGKTPQATYVDMWAHLTAGKEWRGELVNRRRDGSDYIESALISPVRQPDGSITNFLAIKENITDKKLAEQRIQQLAHFDHLTGLPNRSLLNERFSYALSLAQRSGEQLAVMFLDLDHFKNINDTLGHSIGDGFLMEVAKRLKSTIREEDTVSRLGGDEFILVFPGTDADGAALVANKLIEAVSQPYQFDHHELIGTPSIGIAIYPDDGESFDDLMKNADTAMYRVKQNSRNDFRFFTAEMQSHSERNLKLVNALRHALERNELYLHYQPQVNLSDGHIVGAEALLRWQHPELGMVSPAEFIPIAEDSGQIIPIGEWVLRTAVKQMKDWMNRGFPPMVVAVNLSAIQFRQPNFPELVTRILDEAQLAHEHLELELTEAVAMDDPQAAIDVMDKLHERGIRMSIDDFGTGYSSLSYLKRFKVYKLKIDQSFVRNISEDEEDKAIVTAIINLASSLGMHTIAEGVETASQLAFLRLQGCDEVQGYYFSKPLPTDQFEAYLRK